MKKRELAHYRALLLMRRAELVGDVVSMEQEALRGTGDGDLSHVPMHMADQGTDNYEREFTLQLAASERQLLAEIEAALQRITDGTYGICEETGQPISKARLEAKPWARFTIEVARERDRRAQGLHR